jgi:streptomycin 6-kinase
MPQTDIPAAFARAMHEVYGQEGDRWIAALPALIDALADEWQFTAGLPFTLSYNYVAPVTRADGSPAVLKVGYPSREFLNEFAALRSFNGNGAVRLLASDESRGAMLLERLLPGDTLETVQAQDDAEATRIAAGLVRRIWQPPPGRHTFKTVGDLGKGFQRLRAEFGVGAGPFPPQLIGEAEATFVEFESTMAAPVVLHGDFHHGNILDAGDGDWRIIDPKGVVGEPAYEVGPFLYNPKPALYRHSDLELRDILSCRLDIFAAELALDRERLRRWGVAQAVLSAWWSYEDHGHGWENAIRAAGLLQELG